MTHPLPHDDDHRSDVLNCTMSLQVARDDAFLAGCPRRARAPATWPLHPHQSEYLLTHGPLRFVIISAYPQRDTEDQPEKQGVFLQVLIEEDESSQDPDVLLLSPESRLRTFSSARVRLIQPHALMIDFLIVQALDAVSLDFVRRAGEQWAQLVMRQNEGMVVGEGDTIMYRDRDHTIYSYRLTQTAPYQQGLFSAIHNQNSQQIAILPTIAPSLDELSSTRRAPDHLSASILQPSLRSSRIFQSSPLSASFRSLSLLLPPGLSSPERESKRVLLYAKRLEISPRPRSEATHRDFSHEVFVTAPTLAELNISSGSWVCVQATFPHSPSSSYIARLFSVPNHAESNQLFKNDRIYLPPLVLFRLGIHALHEFSHLRVTVEVSPLRMSSLSAAQNQQTNEAESFPPRAGESNHFAIAKRIVLGRVRAPGSADHISAQQFQFLLDHPRVVCTGDILAIPMRRLGYLEYDELISSDKHSAPARDHELSRRGSEMGLSENGRYASSSSSHTTEGREEAPGKDDHSSASLLYDELIESIALLEDNESSQCEKYLFFQVLEVECDQEHVGTLTASQGWNGGPMVAAFIQKGATSLYEISSVNTSLPMCMDSFTRHTLFLPPPGMKAPFQQLMSLLIPFFSGQTQIANMDCSILLHGIRGNGKRTLVRSAVQYLGVHLLEINCYDLLGQGDTQTTEALRICFEQASQILPCVLLLRHLGALEKLASQQQREPQVANAFREYLSGFLHKSSSNSHASQFIVIATENKLDHLSSSLRSTFRHEISLGVPEDSQRRQILDKLFQSSHRSMESQTFQRKGKFPNSAQMLTKNLALKTAGYSVADLQSLISRAHLRAHASLAQNERHAIPSPQDLSEAGLTIMEEHLEEGSTYLQKAHAEELGAPKIPNVQWDDVGGLIKAKKEILDTIQLPLEHPELFSHGVRQRSGVLLYGPPGTGKTLLAKAVATECSLNFMSVKGPELLNMYVGESEKNVRDVFEKARNAKPCVVFFDELDSLAPNRGQGSDSGGVMDRVVSQLLAELDGMQKASEVFIIGATNRPDLLDSALLRPGRLDRLVYLGVCETSEDQLPILEALTRKFDLADDVDLNEIAEHCPNTFTGADFYALCSDTLLHSMKERIESLEKLQQMPLSPEEKAECTEVLQNENLMVHRAHFLEALASITPSVSRVELERYKEVRKQFS